jgi:hypothetical protein
VEHVMKEGQHEDQTGLQDRTGPNP